MESSAKFELVFQFLIEHDLSSTAEALKAETGLSFDQLAGKKSGALDEILDLHHESRSQRRMKEECLFDLIPEGDGVFANTECLSLDDWTGGVSVLCCRLTPEGWLMMSCARRLMVFGRVMLPVGSSRAALPISLNRHGGGVLGVVQHPTRPHLILTCSMDKTSELIDASALMEDNKETLESVQTFSEHSKYVVKARFSACGKWMATASYDHSSCIYKAADESFRHYMLCLQTSFRAAVEAICWHPSEPRCLIAVRDDHLLHCFDCSSGHPESTKSLNLNALGDNHVSFTALDLAFHPNGRLISVATDKDRIILMDSSTENQLANLYGCSNDSFSQPRLCWHPSGRYLYATSQDRCVVVWEACRQREVARLTGHFSQLRDLHYCEGLDVLVSASMDGVVKIWKHN